MPPKRSTRSQSRGPEPVPSQQLERNGAIVGSMMPLPNKFSSSYGSPVSTHPQLSDTPRRSGRIGGSLGNRIGDAVSSVIQGNSADAATREGQGEDSSILIDTVEDTPRDTNYIPGTSRARTHPETPGARGNSRAGSAAPNEIGDFTMRSFMNESNVFNDATFTTPVNPMPPAQRANERAAQQPPQRTHVQPTLNTDEQRQEQDAGALKMQRAHVQETTEGQKRKDGQATEATSTTTGANRRKLNSALRRPTDQRRKAEELARERGAKHGNLLDKVASTRRFSDLGSKYLDGLMSPRHRHTSGRPGATDKQGNRWVRPCSCNIIFYSIIQIILWVGLLAVAGKLVWGLSKWWSHQGSVQRWLPDVTVGIPRWPNWDMSRWTSWERSGGEAEDSGSSWFGHDTHKYDELIPDSRVMTEEEYDRLVSLMRKASTDIAALGRSSNLHKDALDKLNKIVPKIVSLQVNKHGNPVISPDFWHALKNLILDDEIILTLQDKDISDAHWFAVKSRLEKGGFKIPAAADPNAKALSTTEVQDIVSKTLSSSWEMWVENNNAKIAKILGPHMEKTIPASMEKDLIAEAQRVIREKINSDGLREIVVTKEDFIRQLKAEVSSNREHIRAEIHGMEAKFDKLIKDALEASTAKTAGTVDRKEIMKLVNEAIRKAIADARLGAAAKTGIKAEWDSELSKRVNYFSIASGAMVDPRYKSPTWEAPRARVGSEEYKKRKPKGLEGAAALHPWKEDGDCWCGAVTQTKYATGPQPVDLPVTMGESIMPEHVVVEHIYPSATVASGTMPKELEIWVYVEDVELRGKLHDFMTTHFPDVSLTSHSLVARGFVKIGAFMFEDPTMTQNGELQIYKLPQFLVDNEVYTDQVIIRAVSNYGSDRTCFYRVRLFGVPSRDTGA